MFRTRWFPWFLARIALLCAALTLTAAIPAWADDGSPAAVWNLLKQWLDAAPRVTSALWTPGTVALSWESDRLTATWHGTVSVGAAGTVDVPLLASGGAVTEVKVGGSAADWRVSGGMVMLRLAADASRRADVEIVAQWRLAKTAGEAVVVPLPDWPHGTLQGSPAELEVFGADADSGLPHAVRALLVRTQGSLAPRIRAARYRLLLTPGAATVDVRVEVEARGAAGAVAIAPSELALLDVAVDGKPVAPTDGEDDSEHHRVEVSGKGMRVITARLQVHGEGDLADLQVELGRVASPITEVEVRVAGKRSVRFEPEVPVQTTVSGGQTVARAWLPPGETMNLSLATEGDAVERTVRFSAEMWQILTPAEGLLRGQATLDLAVVQGKATAVLIAVPDKVVVSSVDGDGVSTWDVLAPAGDLPRRLRIGFGDDGDATKRQVRIAFEQATTVEVPKAAEKGPEPQKAAEPGPALEIPLLHTLGAFRDSGAVVLLDGEKIGFAPLEGAPGWLRAGLDALPAAVRKDLEGRADQVWRHIGMAPKLVVRMAAARVHEVRLESRSSGLVRIDERTLRDSRVVVVDIKAGRTDKLLLDLPERVGEPRVVAPSLSRVTAAEGQAADKGRKLWELRFSSALEGSIQLQIDLEQLIAADAKVLQLPDVRVRGAEVETEVLAVSAEAGLELVPTTRGETRTVPLPELPEPVARQAGRDFVAGFRSPRGPVQVDLALQRRATVTTLDAFARQVWLDSHVLPDGRVTSRAVVLLQSAGRPVLRVGLPKEAQILAMTVDGVSVKAVRDDKGGLAVPLGGGATVRVEVRYETRGTALGLVSMADVVAPRFDVRQGPLHWTLSLPGDLRVYRLASELRRADGETFPAPPAAAKDDLVPLPIPFAARQVQLMSEVRDAQAETSVTLWIGADPPEALGWLLLLAGIIGGGLWWRLRQKRWMGAALAALLMGLCLLALHDALDSLVSLAVTLGVVGGGVWLMVRVLRNRTPRTLVPPPVPPAPPVPPSEPTVAREDGGEP